MQGVDEALKVYARVDRRLTKERQSIFRKSANRTIVRVMRAQAAGIPGKPGPMIAKAIAARNGKQGAVLVGPRRKMAKATWNGMPIAHFFIVGSKAHEIGGAKAGGTRDFFSSVRQSREAGWKRTRGGWFQRTSTGRSRVLLSSQKRGHGLGHPVYGPVKHPGLPQHDIVMQSWEIAGEAFMVLLKAELFSTEDK